MVSLDNSVTAKLKKGNKEFEIYVDPEMALSYRKKLVSDISKVLASENIFENAKGDKVSYTDLKKVFKTTNIYEIAHQILMDGEINLTTSQRKQIFENKKNSVITYIVNNSINPQTMTPHTRQRIEIAMKEAKVNIDPSKSIEDLVSIVIKSIRPLIPIKLEEMNIEIEIPKNYSSKSFEKISSFGKLIKKEWKNDGSLGLIICIPSGLQNEFFSLINNVTKGEANIKILK